MWTFTLNTAGMWVHVDEFDAGGTWTSECDFWADEYRSDLDQAEVDLDETAVDLALVTFVLLAIPYAIFAD